MEEIYAKIEKRKINGKEILVYQTLEGHVTDCLKIFREYVLSNEKIIKQFCNRWRLDYDHFLSNLFLAIYLHDIAKATKEFQSKIKKGEHSIEYPHPFFAFPVLFWLMKKKEPKIEPILTVEVEDDEKNKIFKPPIELLSIIGHHTQLHDDIYTDVNYNVKFEEDYIIQFINNHYKIYEIIGFSKGFEYKYKCMRINNNDIHFDDLSPTEKEIKKSLSTQIIEVLLKIKGKCEKVLENDKIKLKSIYSFFYSILKLCDCYSSLNFHEFVAEKENLENNGVFSSVLEDPKKYVLNLPNVEPCDIIPFNMYPYQIEVLQNPKEFCLLFAPCGRGKTEAALLWAFEICKRCNRNKIIFAMPTQITSNTMYERLCYLFGKGEKKEDKINDGKKYVGLFHGKSFLEHSEMLKKEKELECDELTDEELEEIKGENFKGNIFFKPITITTIDHLIHSFVHGFRQADFALGNIQNSIIIFDEVHYYEKQTLEHLIALFRILKEMNIPNLLMSGTLPEFFINKVKEINPNYHGPIEDEKGLGFKPFYIETKDEFIVSKEGGNEKVVNEIINNYENGLKQFIILNTIKRSQKFYEELDKKIPNANILLLHSAFTWDDRKEKEKIVMEKTNIKKDKPFILVSTQIIEISLDISCDIMYTEVAPADALGQRGGRLNRGASCPNGSVMKIFKPEEFFINEKNRKQPRPYEFWMLEETIENIENRAYSYRDIKRLCDIVYKNFALEEQKKLLEVFYRCTLFGKRPSYDEEDEAYKLQIRDNSFREMDVIPADVVKEKIVKFCKNENIDTTFLLQQLPMMTIIEHLYRGICEIKGISNKENHLSFKDNTIKISKQSKQDERLKDFFKFLEDVFSVKNEIKIPYYIYKNNIDDLRNGKTNIEIFEYVIYNKKPFWFVRIPYSPEKGLKLDNVYTFGDSNFSNII